VAHALLSTWEIQFLTRFALEIECGDIDKGLWIEAFAEADGDQNPPLMIWQIPSDDLT
jgi:hypothetical protein